MTDHPTPWDEKPVVIGATVTILVLLVLSMLEQVLR